MNRGRKEWRNPWDVPRKKFPFTLLAFVLGTLLLIGFIGYTTAQPTFEKNQPSSVAVDPARLRGHVEMLSQTLHPRSWEHLDNLNQCAEYITTEFKDAGAAVTNQIFRVQGNDYRNVIGLFGAGKGSKIIIGAHYDSCGETPGADDNASGVAGLIELAGLLQQNPPNREVELIAYSLEEPPFFRSKQMGSAFHAQHIANSDREISGVIVLEMIGCFSDERGSQQCPSVLLKLFYPVRGNFIAVAGLSSQKDWVKQVKIGMKGTTDLPVYSICASATTRGIDFSDHRNYWPYGINALMITDTAFFRNRAYHTRRDTADRLDYERMAQVVTAVFEAVQFIP